MTMSHSMLKPRSLDVPHPAHQYSAVMAFHHHLAREKATTMLPSLSPSWFQLSRHRR